jgi:hypothetical protein
MILRDLLLFNKKISFEITNDMGYQVLIDSENIPDDLEEKIHEQIETWYREATQMPDRLYLELYLSEDQIEWNAIAADHHYWDDYSDFIDDILDSLTESDEPKESFSIQFSAEGIISGSETCKITDLYFYRLSEDNEESEIHLSSKQMKLLQSMIIEFVSDNPSQSLNLSADHTFSICVEADTVSYIQKGSPEISQDLLEFLSITS